MAETVHRVQAVPEPTIYPVPDPGSPADPAEAIIGHTLRTAILTACDALADATREYAAASATLAEAVIEEAEARQVLTWHETLERDRLLSAGLPGTTEAVRKAALDRLLLTDNMIAPMRSHLEEAQRARVQAEHHFRVVDQASRSLRARLAALGAVVRGGGGL